MKLVLTRLSIQGNAVIGTLGVPGMPLPLWTLEDLPNGNKPNISCIPADDYKCREHGWNGEPVKFKKVWEVRNVPGRSAILFHAGNTEADTRGCILVGMGVQQGRLLSSAEAIAQMRWKIGANGFDLQIRNCVPAS
ncbi:DUF5675 family protein [Tardiphaga sp.]|jgi:hypothetical protein|uniref:DUF5675 family protein n=1 Tax=Tardiphaga sp. TaxID=1926292 RepID=UPI0037D9FE32